MNRWRTAGVVFAGLIFEGGLIWMVITGNLRTQMPVFFAVFALISLVYLIVIWQVHQIPLAVIMGFGVVFRFTLLFMTPSLSDDIYRYVWDGRVLWAGINPYSYAPAADALMHLRDADVFPLINHSDLPTIYPPVAQVVFGAGYGISEGFWGIKVLLVCADVVTGWLLIRLLRHYKQAEGLFIIYFWHPLVLLEISGSGHVEGVGIAILMAAVLCFVKGRDFWALGALGGAVLVKFLPLVFFPGFVRWLGKVPINWQALLVLPCVVAFAYMPFAWTGAPVLGSLGTYAAHWSFNSPVFDGLLLVFGDGMMVRRVIGGLFAGVVLVLVWRKIPLLRLIYITLAAFVLLT
ncbi:MAG: hypothetical protein QGG64_28425, partial [Candidatus Latescibacteria bacterium]|nr:hypothetical protein [Candidatus Latescibacterota bacterium]